MRHKVTKVFFAWQHEKEEQWLNAMSHKGLQLVGVSGLVYTFEEGTPGEYLYRLEFLERRPTHPESVAYIRFLEDTGVEQIGSILRWVYFRKRAADGGFDLFSDLESRIRHFQRIRGLMFVAGGVNLPGFIRNVIDFIAHGYTEMIAITALQLVAIGLTFTGVFILTGKIKKLKVDRQLRE